MLLEDFFSVIFFYGQIFFFYGQTFLKNLIIQKKIRHFKKKFDIQKKFDTSKKNSTLQKKIRLLSKITKIVTIMTCSFRTILFALHPLNTCCKKNPQ